MKPHCLTILAVLSSALVHGSLATQTAPRVATDENDYSPGSSACISGAGFQPGEAVRLQILRIDVDDNDCPEHQPWQVRADKRGQFDVPWLVTTHEAGATLQLTATGVASGFRTEFIFKDAAITPASGGNAISADTYAGAFTPLSGPVIVETAVGDISVGTIVLAVPAGFEFDTNAPLPVITLNGDNNHKNINGLSDGDIIPLTVTTNSVSFSITSKSKGQTRNTLTYSNLRVRPTAGAPLASGNITNTGTSSFPNSTTNFGTLAEAPGSITRLAVSGFPSPQTAGVAGSVIVTAQDQFGNLRPTYTGTVHFASSDPLAVLPADYAFLTGHNGTHSFSGVALKTLGNQSITVTNLGTASRGSQNGISIIPAPADHIAFVTQPGSATYGSLLSPQPILVSQDPFGNNSTAGLGSSKIVTLTLSSGSGALTGTTSLDIGTAAGNGTVTFSNLTVNAGGASKQLTASAAGLSSAVSGAFTISPATVTAIVTVSNKVYDATTGATIGTRTLSGVLGSDIVTLTGGTANFASKSVANGKTVNVTGLGLSGASAANYSLGSTTAITTANIGPAALAVSGAIANDKVYDGTTTATVSGGSLSGLMSGDGVTLGGTVSANFASRAVGINKPVSASGYVISGPDSGNYTVTQPSGLSANITRANLNVSGITANNKPYDGNTSATLNTGTASLAGVFSGDSVTLNTGSASGAFANKSAGTAKVVNVTGLTVTGPDSGNYSLTQPSTSADITVKGLAISGVTASNKSYDGNTAATLSSSGAILVGVLSGDGVTLDSGSASAEFANADSGIGKSITVSGFVISGADSGNYSLTQPTAIANINPVALMVSADDKSRAYGCANPPFTASYTGFVNGEDATVLSGVPALNTAANTNSPVGTYSIEIAVGSLGSVNYIFSVTNGSLAVMPYPLTVTADNKSRTYGEGNPGFTGNLLGLLNGDNISANFGTLANANSPVGTYSIVPSLTDPNGKLTNYSVTLSNGTLNVTPAPLLVAAHSAARGYGEANPNFSATVSGYVNGEGANDLSGTLLLTTTAQASSLPGDYPITPSGLSSGNYSINYSAGTLTVTTTNQPPVLDWITNAVVLPDQVLTIYLHASDPNGDATTLSLDPGMPAGAFITNVVRTQPVLSTNTVFRWRPTRGQASTTNLITVRVSDNGGPSMSAEQTFTVIVLDYLEVSLPSTNLQSGQTVALPISLASSEGVTNLSFNIQWPDSYLANAALTVMSAGIGSAVLQDQGTNLALSFQAAPGQVLQGTQQIAQLTFTAISNEYSAFVWLPFVDVSATKPDELLYTNYITPAARIAVIEGQPLLWASLLSNSSRQLTLFGRVGVSYELQHSTNLALPTVWNSALSYVQTNGVQTLEVDSVNPNIFYRIFQP
jgi:hypothetical protein